MKAQGLGVTEIAKALGIGGGERRVIDFNFLDKVVSMNEKPDGCGLRPASLILSLKSQPRVPR